MQTTRLFFLTLTCSSIFANHPALKELEKKIRIHYKNHKSDLFFKEAKELNHLALYQGKEIYQGIAFMYYGEYFLENSQNDSALYYYRRSSRIFEQNNFFKYKRLLMQKTAQTFYYCCDYFTAQKLYIKLFNNSCAAQDTFHEYCALLSLGIISSDLGEYDKAISFTIRAMKKIATLSPLDCCEESCLNNIGFNYFKEGKLELSLKYYLKARRKLAGKRNPELVALLLDNIANSKKRLHPFEDVSNLYREAASLRKENNILQGSDYNEMSYANWLYDNHKLILANQHALNALALAKSFNSPSDCLDALKTIVRINKEQSSTYATQYIKISDSLQLAERRNRNKFARIAFETDEIIHEKDEAIKQKRIAIATGSGLLLCSVMFMIIRIQRSRQRELVHTQQQQRSDQEIYDLVHSQQNQLDQARQFEKSRIARELHDGVMNRLSSTRLNLYVLGSKRDDETIDKCVRLIDDLQNVEKELRQVAHELSDDIFSGNKSFNVLIHALIDDVRPITNAQFHVEIDEHINWELCEGALKINTYRILQEALQNIRKYSEAKNIFITLSKIDDDLKLVIYDDGIGFNPDKRRKGIGIKNIFSRVDALSGTIKMLTQPDQGVAFNISLPFSKA